MVFNNELFKGIKWFFGVRNAERYTLAIKDGSSQWESYPDGGGNFFVIESDTIVSLHDPDGECIQRIEV